MTDAVYDVDQITTESKAEFNLMDRLQSRSVRTKDVTVFTDEVLGAEHKELQKQLELARIANADQVELAALEVQVKDAAKQVYASGITFKLRALPPVVRKSVSRKVRKDLGIKGPVTQDRIEEFLEQHSITLLADSIEQYTDIASGTVVTDITANDTKALKEFLPEGEYDRLDTAVNDLSVEAHISDTVTTDADF